MSAGGLPARRNYCGRISTVAMKAKMPKSASFQKSPRLRRPGTPKGRIRCAIIKSRKMTEKSLLIGAALPHRPTPRHGRRPARRLRFTAAGDEWPDARPRPDATAIC